MSESAAITTQPCAVTATWCPESQHLQVTPKDDRRYWVLFGPPGEPSAAPDLRLYWGQENKVHRQKPRIFVAPIPLGKNVARPPDDAFVEIEVQVKVISPH